MEPCGKNDSDPITYEPFCDREGEDDCIPPSRALQVPRFNGAGDRVGRACYNIDTLVDWFKRNGKTEDPMTRYQLAADTLRELAEKFRAANKTDERLFWEYSQEEKDVIRLNILVDSWVRMLQIDEEQRDPVEHRRLLKFADKMEDTYLKMSAQNRMEFESSIMLAIGKINDDALAYNKEEEDEEFVNRVEFALELFVVLRSKEKFKDLVSPVYLKQFQSNRKGFFYVFKLRYIADVGYFGFDPLDYVRDYVLHPLNIAGSSLLGAAGAGGLLVYLLLLMMFFAFNKFTGYTADDIIDFLRPLGARVQQIADRLDANLQRWQRQFRQVFLQGQQQGVLQIEDLQGGGGGVAPHSEFMLFMASPFGEKLLKSF